MLKFNAQDVSFREPKGAVPAGTQVTLRLAALRSEFFRCELVMIDDARGVSETVPMTWCDLKGDMDYYECRISCGNPGLLWYYFIAYTFFEEPRYLGCDGERCEEPRAFQLTVYDASLRTPDWFQGGVTYQVFVDRFCRGEDIPLPEDPDYFVHINPHELPHYRPNANGEIENRDIFGGDLRGVIKKLSYLESLGVRTIYLSPIFEAWSNHKYNTADYLRIDPHFGDEETLRALCDAARKHGMRVILDGVFNHTGSDSVYFNKNGRYDSVGAFQSETSQYRKWYNFTPDGGYDTWWGIQTLPAVNEMNEEYRALIHRAVRKWMGCGVSGWRLDVADELPDEFLRELHSVVSDCDMDALVIGEVWEDASNKVAYGVRRKYFTDIELDGVMNYPLKNAILGFLTGQVDAAGAAFIMNRLCEHYPAPVLRCLMNIIGTHDTVRALTVLSEPPQGLSREEKARYAIPELQKQSAFARMRAAAVLQFAFPGSPCIYYGDEAGCEGFEDPFNRKFFPWGQEEMPLLAFYQALGRFRSRSPALADGEFSVLYAAGDVLLLARKCEAETVLIGVNRSMESQSIYLRDSGKYYDIWSGKYVKSRLGWLVLRICGGETLLLTNRPDLSYNTDNKLD